MRRLALVFLISFLFAACRTEEVKTDKKQEEQQTEAAETPETPEKDSASENNEADNKDANQEDISDAAPIDETMIKIYDSTLLGDLPSESLSAQVTTQDELELPNYVLSISEYEMKGSEITKIKYKMNPIFFYDGVPYQFVYLNENGQNNSDRKSVV